MLGKIGTGWDAKARFLSIHIHLLLDYRLCGEHLLFKLSLSSTISLFLVCPVLTVSPVGIRLPFYRLGKTSAVTFETSRMEKASWHKREG